MPERIQLRRSAGWRKPEGVVSVVRGTDYGNPFRVGDRVWLIVGSVARQEVVITPALAVALFTAWLDEQPGWRQQGAAELHGKTLACWCRPDAPCHADVWLALAAAVSPGEASL